jgi:hypothetical protein
LRERRGVIGGLREEVNTGLGLALLLHVVRDKRGHK